MITVYFKITMADADGNTKAYWEDRQQPTVARAAVLILPSVIGEAQTLVPGYNVTKVEISERPLR